MLVSIFFYTPALILILIVELDVGNVPKSCQYQPDTCMLTLASIAEKLVT